LVSALALLMVSTSGTGPIADQPTPATPDLLGSWSCSLSPVSVSGICPKGPRQSGTCEIRKSAGALTLEYVSGFRCSPKAACSFSCVRRGDSLSCQNAGPADSEGGRYATSLELAAGPAKAVSGTAMPVTGTGKSSYTGPGIRCEWTSSLMLTRPVASTKPR
jgi:hypothetical protein